MFDMMLLFAVGFAGGLIALISFASIVGKRMSEPNGDLLKKVEKLEKETRLRKDRKEMD
ncbi:MAG TPA: hypothetical protein VIG80_12045 [Bacillaceae bacterium]